LKSIRYKVLIVLIGACLFPSVILLWVTNRITGAAIENSQFAKIEGVGAEIARQVVSSMEATNSSLEILSLNKTLQNPKSTKEERIEVMEQMVNAFKRFSDITIYGPDGFMLADESTTKHGHPEPVERTRWFEEAQDTRKIVTSTPHRVNGVEGLHIKVYIPVHIGTYTKPHILKARVSFDGVWDLIGGARISEEGTVVLLNSRGSILYHPDKSKVLDIFDGEKPASYWQSNNRTDYVDSAGQKHVYWATAIEPSETNVGEEWTLISMLPRDQVNAAIKQSQRLQLVIACVIILVAMVVGVWLAHGFASPLILASDAAEQVAGGNLMARLPEERGSTEIRRLSLSFNMMIDEVREHRNKLSSLVERRTRKLRDSEMRLKKTSAMLLASYEATQEAVLVVDPNGYIVAANGHFGAFFGLESETLPGRSIADLECSITQCFETPEVFRGEWKQLIQDPYAYLQSDWNLVEPEPRSLSIYSAPVSDREGVLCARLWMFRDTSEQHRLQLGLQQAQKMEAVGRLAGGVAHDFNNLLTGIIGNLSLAQIGTGPDGETPEELVEVAKGAGERAAELVKQLLGFSRRTHLKVIIGDCNKVLSDVDLLTRRTIDPRIKIEVDQEPNLWGAKVDLNMIEQVVMNMVVNAKDAMPGAGTISMRTRNVTLEAEQLSENVRAAPGDYIAITVADNGEGMPPEVLQKVYEPFFTTKEQGKGTGLGLATSYGIIRQHEGWIDCVSKVGEGTVFNIYLPKAAETADVEPKKVPEAPIVDRGGSETILLVDDEKVVRTVAQSVLKHHGYNTLAAEDGLVALEHFARDQEGIDLVLLDLTMPNLSGADTFKRIRAEYGDVPVIVCSGYAVNLDEFEAENGARPNGFVQKPYNIADLAQRVREVLNEACLTA
jgi:two-component system cell cycle sensor histidine kinase/response regulator CckA